jgi:hypothetical protein
MARKNNRRTKRRRNKRSRRNKRKSRRRRSRSRRRKQKGGCGSCGLKNMGQYYTLRPQNNLAGPALDWLTPKGTNQSLHFKQLKGGKRRRRRRRSRMKGGRKSRNQRGGASVLQALGLGDVLNAYHSLGNSLTNIGNSWGGKDPTESSRVTDQKIGEDVTSKYIVPDIEQHHNTGVATAASIGI